MNEERPSQDHPTPTANRAMGRRQVLLTLGAATALGRTLYACSSTDTTADSAAGAGGSAGASGNASAGSTTAGAAGADSGATSWATGGTAAMTDKANYPNPFSDIPSTCTVSCELTEGPCYSAQSVEIQDISYGYDGLPMRLYLRILDETCAPVSGATVDVWHVGPTGIYSGADSVNEDIAFCTGNDADFSSHLYFRGKQISDANGEVYFDTCFPGWYASRTIHVHMTISVAGTAFVTTQFGFDDTLDNSIIATQPLYDARGSRDTTNATDTVLPATGLSDYLFDTEQMTDGAMLAWKTIILRSAVSETICSPSGANASATPGGDGGPGGPGGDGGPPA